MRIVDALKGDLFSQLPTLRRFKLPEGRWGNRTSGQRSYGVQPPRERPTLQPNLSSKLVTAKTPQVTMADKANKVIEKQFNK